MDEGTLRFSVDGRQEEGGFEGLIAGTLTNFAFCCYEEGVSLRLLKVILC